MASGKFFLLSIAALGSYFLISTDVSSAIELKSAV
jgi:hypothetical protein